MRRPDRIDVVVPDVGPGGAAVDTDLDVGRRGAEVGQVLGVEAERRGVHTGQVGDRRGEDFPDLAEPYRRELPASAMHFC
jgi:hypothetical protein